MSEIVKELTEEHEKEKTEQFEEYLFILSKNKQKQSFLYWKYSPEKNKVKSLGNTERIIALIRYYLRYSGNLPVQNAVRFTVKKVGRDNLYEFIMKPDEELAHLIKDFPETFDFRYQNLKESVLTVKKYVNSTEDKEINTKPED